MPRFVEVCEYAGAMAWFGSGFSPGAGGGGGLLGVSFCGFVVGIVHSFIIRSYFLLGVTETTFGHYRGSGSHLFQYCWVRFVSVSNHEGSYRSE